MQEGQTPGQQPNTNWSFNQNDPTSVPAATTMHPADIQEVSWTASEFIAHQKPLTWYALLGLGSVIVAGGVLLLTNDKISAVMVIIVAIIFGVMGARQPRTLVYSLTHNGLRIGEKFYSYADFKSFSVLEDGAFFSILLLPMKRFMPGVSIYYPPEQEDSILAVLGTYLPHEKREVDALDRFMRKVRF